MMKSKSGEIAVAGEEASQLWNRLVKAATSTFAIQIASIGLRFTTSIILARLLGTIGYGAYSYALAWLSLLEVPAVFGQKTILVRNIAAYRAQSAWDLTAGLLKWADKLVLLLSLALTLVGFTVIWIITDRLDSETLVTLSVALFVLPLVALTRLRQATLQGLHHVVAGQLPEKIVRPVSLIILVGIVHLFIQRELSAPWAVGLDVIAMGVAFIVAKWMLDLVCPLAVKEAVPVYQTRMWMRSALPIMFIVGMNIVNTRADILMLGALKGNAMVGIYTVADRGAQFVFFAMTAVSVPLNPLIASLYASGQKERLQYIVTKITRIVSGLSLLIVVGLTVFGNWFLLLFGTEFTEGYVALAILNCGQLLTVAMGPVGWLLVMTGHQRDAALVSGVGTGLNIILNLMLIPEWGVEGAATATTISTIISNFVLTIMVYKRLQVHPTVVGTVNVWRKLERD
jgi:O-antigen/teichoic acid export membrane protein